jgi:hypothetical protein
VASQVFCPAHVLQVFAHVATPVQVLFAQVSHVAPQVFWPAHVLHVFAQVLAQVLAHVLAQVFGHVFAHVLGQVFAHVAQVFAQVFPHVFAQVFCTAQVAHVLRQVAGHVAATVCGGGMLPAACATRGLRSKSESSRIPLIAVRLRPSLSPILMISPRLTLRRASSRMRSSDCSAMTISSFFA